VFLSHPQVIQLSFSKNVRVKKRIEMTWKKFRSLGFILAENFQKLETKKDVLESCVFQVILHGAQA
jgi:hypothetical protein